MKEFKIGSEVCWSGSWGRDVGRPANLEYIEQTENEHEKDGVEVDSVKWINGQWEFPFVCGLDNGHWAYSYQIKPYGV